MKLKKREIDERRNHENDGNEPEVLAPCLPVKNHRINNEKDEGRGHKNARTVRVGGQARQNARQDQQKPVSPRPARPEREKCCRREQVDAAGMQANARLGTGARTKKQYLSL